MTHPLTLIVLLPLLGARLLVSSLFLQGGSAGAKAFDLGLKESKPGYLTHVTIQSIAIDGLLQN